MVRILLTNEEEDLLRSIDRQKEVIMNIYDEMTHSIRTENVEKTEPENLLAWSKADGKG